MDKGHVLSICVWTLATSILFSSLEILTFSAVGQGLAGEQIQWKPLDFDFRCKEGSAFVRVAYGFVMGHARLG